MITEEIKNGWAARGNGWAVHAPTEEEAINKYTEREKYYKWLDSQSPAGHYQPKFAGEEIDKTIIVALLLQAGSDEVVISDDNWNEARRLVANGYYIEASERGRVVGIVPF